uniref:AB hydrolase-1 domain-containing protein n=1 Tax=Tetradesmus obliquus TaxID=3088 RepID=A0A383V6Z1_TETOB|eukprot:jgi/Sobl393_1/6860/SZX60499.1
MLHEAAQRLHVRLIAVDRPGFGGTPFTPQHSLQNWASALQQLSDHLAIGRFGILGASGGAPFAAACARFIGEQRVTGLGLLCPLGPVDGSTRPGMTAANALLLAMARRCPGVARAVWRATGKWLAWDEHCMQRFALNPQDKQALQSTPHIAQAIRAAVLEGLSAGAWGVVHEMALAQRCWGFRLQDIQVPHAFLWHGLQDPLVTLAMARAYESIPGCQAVYFPSETHTTLVVNRLCLALEALAAGQAGHGAAAASAPVGVSAACGELPSRQFHLGLRSSSSSSSSSGGGSTELLPAVRAAALPFEGSSSCTASRGLQQ